LQSLSGKATIQIVSGSLVPALQFIVIAGVIAGVGLIGYDAFLNRQTAKELARRDRDELKQADGQNSEPNERDDRYTPTDFR
jgi:uncharacterized membrane protein YebE (DUF533 family)